MREVEISNQADEDIEAIFDYSTERFGLEQTIKYLLYLESKFDFLAQNPMTGKIRNELKTSLYSFVYVSHIIFYHFNNEKVRIERVLHSSRDLTEDLWFK
jgi:toxin ParE1/3/4